jgi:PAS domain S-box-containing protein
MMAAPDNEEAGLREVVLRNAQNILLARRQSEEALRRHAEWLRVTLASIGDAVISTDADGRITFMNRVAEALTGWTQDEAFAQPLPEVFRIINEQTRQPVENPALRALRDGTIVGLANHTVLIARDGTERPIDDSAAPMRDDMPAPIGTVLVFRDVTERKRADEARARLAAIVESSDDAIVSKTLEGIIRSWNLGAERIFGFTAAEAVGRHITLIIPPERHEEETGILARLRRGERIDHFETVRMAKDGRRLHISLTVSPVRNDAGEIIGASKIARDITERKRTQEGAQFLLDASTALAAIVDYASTLNKVAHLAVPFFADWCAIDMVQDDGTLRRLAAVHTDPAKIALATELSRRYPPRPDFPHGALHVLRTGRPDMLADIPDTMVQVIAQDEAHLRALRELGLRSYLAVPLAAHGRIHGVIGFVMAESGRRYGSADLTLAEDLAHRAAVAIENSRLYAELRKADRRKDEFIALLAHELRNPLAPIRNGLQVMRLAGSDAQTTAQARAMMERQLDHMVRLIDDLLDISRINQNKMELRRGRILLADVVASAVEAARPLIEAGRHQLTVQLPTEPVFLDADLTRLAQVFGNLLTNSAKYTEPGGHIWLSAEQTGREVMVAVRDTGIGIPTEALPRIFDMFAQVGRSMERSAGGLGIGLALVKALVEMHGGTVHAASPGAGRGSTFTVRLPALRQPAAVNETLGPEPPRPTAPRRRMLVVDDIRDSAESLALMLGLTGAEVMTAHDGLEAVALAERFRPEVVLMDVGMPRLNGYEATRQMRAQPWGKNLIIIALTGWGQEADRVQSKQAGCNGHLVKPVTLADLEKLLATLMPPASV